MKPFDKEISFFCSTLIVCKKRQEIESVWLALETRSYHPISSILMTIILWSDISPLSAAFGAFGPNLWIGFFCRGCHMFIADKALDTPRTELESGNYNSRPGFVCKQPIWYYISGSDFSEPALLLPHGSPTSSAAWRQINKLVLEQLNICCLF